MRVTRLFLTGVTAMLVSTVPCLGQMPSRVRGNVTSIGEGNFIVQQPDGRIFKLKTDSSTTYADVIPSSLDAIEVASYIGTAIKGPMNQSTAVEIVLVPESMRPGRKGFYPWDPLPDPTIPGSHAIVETYMTNGVVTKVSPLIARRSDIDKPNGLETTDGRSIPDRTLTVALIGNKIMHMRVPSTAPIVRFVVSDRSAISVGATVVVWIQPDSKATLVAVGRGGAPPM